MMKSLYYTAVVLFLLINCYINSFFINWRFRLTRIKAAIDDKAYFQSNQIKSTINNKKQSFNNNNIIKVDNIQYVQWNLASSFNSTTLKNIIQLQDEIVTSLMRFERTLSKLTLLLIRKVQNDIKLTSMTKEYVTQRAVKDTKRLLTGVDDLIISPLLTLPKAIDSISKDNNKLSILKEGINPMNKPRLLTNLQATNTKERAKKINKKPSSILSKIQEDNMYKSLKTLPMELNYEYNRRVISRENQNNKQIVSKIDNLLPSSNEVTASSLISDLAKELPTLSLPAESVSNKIITKESQIGLSSNTMIKLQDEYTWVAREFMSLEYVRLLREYPNDRFIKELRSDLMILSDSTLACLDVTNELSNNQINKIKLGLETIVKYSHIIPKQIKSNQLDCNFNETLLKRLYDRVSDNALFYTDMFIHFKAVIPTTSTVEDTVYESETVYKSTSISKDKTNILTAALVSNNAVDSKVASNDYSNVIETTADSYNTNEKQLITLVLQSIDVILFLFEKLFTSVSTIIQSNGELFLNRAIDTYCINEMISLVNLFINNLINKSQLNNNWKVYKQLKNIKI